MLWIPIDETDTEEIENLHEMSISSDKTNNLLASTINFEYNIHKIHSSLFVDISTRKILEFCTPYYEYMGIRTQVPNQRYNVLIHCSICGQPHNGEYHKGIFKTDRSWADPKPNRFNDGNPAVWVAIGLFATEAQAGCGNSHQYQLKSNHLTNGLYKNENNKWYKQLIV